MLESGELAALMEQGGVSGVTSTPAIFEKAITDSDRLKVSAGQPCLSTAQDRNACF